MNIDQLFSGNYNNYYRKPDEICQVNDEIEDILTEHEILNFVNRNKRNIENNLAKLGLQIRKATEKDLITVKNIISELSSPEVSARFGDSYMFLILKYGKCIFFETSEGEIAAIKLTVGFVNEEHTSHSVYVAVRKSYQNKELAIFASQYTSLLHMEANQQFKRSWIHPSNFASLKNSLNHVGYIIDSFPRSLFTKDEARLTVVLPLTPAGISNNRIAMNKVLKVIETTSQGSDYRTVACSDIDQIHDIYDNTEFRIVAFISKGTIDKEAMFFALPEYKLHFPKQ